MLLGCCSVLAQQQTVFSTQQIAQHFSVQSLSRSVELGGASTRSSSVFTLQRTQTGSSSSSSSELDFVFSINEDADDPASGQLGQLAWLDATIGKTGASRKPVAVRLVGHDPEQ